MKVFARVARSMAPSLFGRIWAPNYAFLTPSVLAEARALGIVVIPWTVNDPATIAALLDMGVDGITSTGPTSCRPSCASVAEGKGADVRRASRARGERVRIDQPV